MTMKRDLLACGLGVIAAGLAIAAVEALAHGRLSGAALFAAVAAGYGLGAFAGSIVAARIAPARWPALLATLVLAGLAIVNLLAFPHPSWFAPAAAIALAGGHLAGRAGRRDRTTPGE